MKRVPVIQIGCGLYPSQINCPGSDVNVHQIVDNPTLNVTFMLMHQNLLPRVENFHEAVMMLRLFIH